MARLEPCGHCSAPAALQLSRFAWQSVKVVLSGQGADEPLGGYERHQAGAVLGLLGRFPPTLGRLGLALANAVPRNERLTRAGARAGGGDRCGTPAYGSSRSQTVAKN